MIKNAKIIQYFVVSQCGHFEWLARERLLFNRLAILILLYSGIIGYDSLYIKTLDTGIGIFGGLFHSTSITHSFNLFLSIIGAIVLLLTAFYPRRLKEPYPSAEGQQFFLIPRQKITSVFTEYSKYTISYLEISKKKLINKMGEQFTIIEYPFNYFITGFCFPPIIYEGGLGESCFNLSVTKSNNKLGWKCLLNFSIGLHSKDFDLLEKIKSFFGVGNIYTRKSDGSVHYSVQSIKHLANVIIPHGFAEKYPLISQKRADFELFKLAVEILNNKEDFSIEDLNKIVAIKAAMNSGLSGSLKEANISKKDSIKSSKSIHYEI